MARVLRRPSLPHLSSAPINSFAEGGRKGESPQGFASLAAPPRQTRNDIGAGNPYVRFTSPFYSHRSKKNKTGAD